MAVKCGLLSTYYGCPDGHTQIWDTGYISLDTSEVGTFQWTPNAHTQGLISSQNVKLTFCIGENLTWAVGSYCIWKTSHTCPPGKDLV